ncbi:MAG: anthranilate synthase component I [Lacipirellulaceae bacterium]
MAHQPHFERFQELAARHDYVPVYRELVSDALTPVQAFKRLDQGVAAGLFESVIGGEKVGRYSFIASDPFVLLTAYGNQVEIQRRGEDGSDWSKESSEAADPLEVLRSEIDAVNVAHLDELPPFIGGAVGYAGYDTVRYVEKLPNAPENDRGLPDLAFGLFDHMVVFDHVRKVVYVLVLVETKGLESDELQSAYEAGEHRVDGYVEQLNAVEDSVQLADIQTGGEITLDYQSNFTEEQFKSAVEKCVEYIRAGDIFQVVISQRLEVPFELPPFELYRTLRVVNPSPFMFYLRMPGATLVGSSPEIMVRVVDGRVTVRPLAGTRKRGADEAEDQRLAEELLADPKERAEHVMLVDLGRNDVGRVAQFGTVEISDVMVIERYSHVMHITSNVNGQLTEDKDSFDALAACLPAGTVSGAPKVRAMEIIDEIEPHRRGPYAGAVGYLDFAGNMDTCIALRTFVIADGKAYVQAGAGIVADSDPAAEYQETLNKAGGLLKAVEITRERCQ